MNNTVRIYFGDDREPTIEAYSPIHFTESDLKKAKRKAEEYATKDCGLIPIHSSWKQTQDGYYSKFYVEHEMDKPKKRTPLAQVPGKVLLVLDRRKQKEQPDA